MQRSRVGSILTMIACSPRPRARRHHDDINVSMAAKMTQTRKPDEPGGVDKVGEETKVAATEKSGGQTLQELERIQFDALAREPLA